MADGIGFMLCSIAMFILCRFLVPFHLLYWAALLKIYIPSMEDFGKVYHMGNVNVQMFFVIFGLGLSHLGSNSFYLKVSNELIYLKLTLPLGDVTLKA